MANVWNDSTEAGPSISNYMPDKTKNAKSVIPFKKLEQWQIFNSIDANILKKIKVAYVFGPSASTLTGIFVTVEDNVYSIGCNANGCLGIGRMMPKYSHRPMKIESLCGKRVESFMAGDHPLTTLASCFAITHTGHLYSWGFNPDGQLGLGHHNQTLIPTLVDMNGKAVKSVAASSWHSLILTKCGDLYGCGNNDSGQITGLHTKIVATRIEIPNKNCKFVTISCGHGHSCALTENGEVFLWGWNRSGQVGVENSKSHLDVPTILCNVGGVVKQVACGLTHTVILTKDAKLYTFGGNDVGQLGNGSKISHSSILIQPLPNRFIQNFTVSGNLTACKIDHQYYIWGEDIGLIPRIISLASSFHDVLRSLGQRNMYKQLEATDMDDDDDYYKQMSILALLEKDFYAQDANKGTTDVEFIVEGKIVMAHKVVLSRRSAYFENRFSSRWANVQENGPINLPDNVTTETFWAFLRYIYTDKVPFPKEEIEHIIDLLILADYFCESRLKMKCEVILQGVITLENALPLFLLASKYNAGGLKYTTLNFSVAHWEGIVKGGFVSDCDLNAQEYLIFKEAWFAEKKDVNWNENWDA